MVINNFYDKELQALKTDEANIHFFCEKIKCLIPEKMDEAYDLINTVIHFCDENLLETGFRHLQAVIKFFQTSYPLQLLALPVFLLSNF